MLTLKISLFDPLWNAALCGTYCHQEEDHQKDERPKDQDLSQEAQVAINCPLVIAVTNTTNWQNQQK